LLKFNQSFNVYATGPVLSDILVYEHVDWIFACNESLCLRNLVFY